MTENASAPAPDEQPTAPLPPVGASSAAPPAAAEQATAYPNPAPQATAYPSTGPVPPRRRVPGWVVAASAVGGVALLGIGFAAGLGTGVLVTRNHDGVAERADLRGSMMNRLGQGGVGNGGEGWSLGGRPGGGQGQLGGGRARPGNDGAVPSPSTDGSTANP